MTSSNDFQPGDLVYYVFNDGETAMCTVKEVKDDERMWVTWHKDGFVNLMPKNKFVNIDSWE